MLSILLLCLASFQILTPFPLYQHTCIKGTGDKSGDNLFYRKHLETERKAHIVLALLNVGQAPLLCLKPLVGEEVGSHTAVLSSWSQSRRFPTAMKHRLELPIFQATTIKTSPKKISLEVLKVFHRSTSAQCVLCVNDIRQGLLQGYNRCIGGSCSRAATYCSVAQTFIFVGSFLLIAIHEKW